MKIAIGEGSELSHLGLYHAVVHLFVEQFQCLLNRFSLFHKYFRTEHWTVVQP